MPIKALDHAFIDLPRGIKLIFRMLAELPQTAKQKNWRLRSFRKRQNKKFSACGASANGKTKNLMLAELPQMANQKF